MRPDRAGLPGRVVRLVVEFFISDTYFLKHVKLRLGGWLLWHHNVCDPDESTMRGQGVVAVGTEIVHRVAWEVLSAEVTFELSECM